MSVWFALLLGLTQGITEFLPVSSSAHLCLLQALFPEEMGRGSGLTFDVLLHLATLAAVCAAYWPDVRALLGFSRGRDGLRRIGMPGSSCSCS